MELSLQTYIDKEREELTLSNFNELKTILTENVKKYKELIVDEKEIDLAKKDRADLNKKKKAINDLKNSTINRIVYQFKNQCDELVSIIDTASSNIDLQIKAFENRVQEEKRTLITSYFKTVNRSSLKLESIWNDKWLNKTYLLDRIKIEINALTLEQYQKDQEEKEIEFYERNGYPSSSKIKYKKYDSINGNVNDDDDEGLINSSYSISLFISHDNRDTFNNLFKYLEDNGFIFHKER